MDPDNTPECFLRLATVVYKFKAPAMTKRTSFVRAFKTVGTGQQAKVLMTSADECRDKLYNTCESSNVVSEKVIEDSNRYQPHIHTVLISCKVQPDQARLDERLIFEWKSGIELKPVPYKSEVMMYDFVMTLACAGLGHAMSGCENSVTGDFVAASRDFANAAGIYDLLGEEQLPKWTSKGDNGTDEAFLPLECHVIMAKVLTILFMASGQQMAIATVLSKDGKPNYSLVSKLCYGVNEQLDSVLNLLKGKAANQMTRLDPEFITLITLQSAIQKAFSLYFQARTLWEADQFGLAIALLSEASVLINVKKNAVSDGVIDVTKNATLKYLADDFKDIRLHMVTLLRSWEKDNSTIYFTSVPTKVPSDKKLKEGVQMKKKNVYTIQPVEPVLLSVPKYSILNVGGLFAKKASS